MARTLRAGTGEQVTQLAEGSGYARKRSGVTPRHRCHETLWGVEVARTPLPIGARAEGSERTWMGRNRVTSLSDLEPTPVAEREDGRARSEATLCQAKPALGRVNRRQHTGEAPPGGLL